MKIFKKKNVIYVLIILIIIILLYIIKKLYTIKEYFTNNKEFNIYVSYSSENTKFGDAIFILVYFYNIKDYIENNNIVINYYIKSQFIDNIKEFNCCSNNIFFYDIKDKPDNAIDIWIGGKWNNNAHTKLIPNKMPFNEYLPIILSEIGKSMSLPPIEKFEYDDKSLLERYNNLDYKYKNLDILIINGSGGSANVNISKEDWDMYINKLNKDYNIVTTEKVDNILCTRDYNLKVKDIAALSTNVKYIITINTGPFIALFNTITLSNVIKWYVFDNTTYCSGNNFKNVKTFNEIDL